MSLNYETDVACIGGGPASAFAAIEILKNHKMVDIFEEHKEIGIPINCAGLISVKGFDKLKIKLPQDCIQYKVKGSKFYSPSGHEFFVKRKDIQAYVIDRAIFDKFLIQKVEDLDGKVHLNSKVLSIIKKNKTAIGLKVKKGIEETSINSKIIIDGEGVRSKIIKQMGIKASRLNSLVPAIQYELKNLRIDQDYVEIYMGRKISPGFFAYIIPTSDTTARVAVGSRFGKPINYIKYFIKKHPIASKKLKNGIIYQKGGGLIMIGGPIRKTYAPGFMGVGDSVGQVKATTGGGVVFGGLCAKIAGNVAVEALNRGDFSEMMMKNYQKLWTKEYLNELRLMKLVRFVLNSIPDKLIDELFRSIENQGITKMMEDIGDMDMQGELIKKIIFGPKIFNLISSILFGVLFH
ncbi:MAG: NAD(P)/FAD-dependent oxidoreductase [Candidatus Lokiarchaeota archaeon]|nr:NAD(P)/FAD-dependent oxidoreductase [Candidatus Lokiarchaeota archaeon]